MAIIVLIKRVKMRLMNLGESLRTRYMRLALLSIAAVVLALHARWFSFICDDAYISFVYARNLARHGQLVFNLGERVEGYTNFLWTVILAGFFRIGANPEKVSLLLGTLSGMATLFVTARISASLNRVRSNWDVLPAVLLAGSSGFACWSSGGLETQLFTFLVTLSLMFIATERLAMAGFACGLAALTRPEGVMVFGIVVAYRAIVALTREHRWRPDNREIAFMAAFAVLWAPYFAWRWSYYGWPLPNTYYVRTPKAPDPEFLHALWSQGGFYVLQWAWQSNALFAVPLIALGAWRGRRLGALLLALVLAYLIYIIPLGGDFMGLHRLLMPVFVAVALLASWGVREVWERTPARSRRLAVAALLLVLGAHLYKQAEVSVAAMEPRFDHGIDRPGYLARYTHDRKLIAETLAPHIKPDDLVIIGGAGVTPYYAPMHAIDVFGLVSPEIAHTVTPTNPRPGHELWAPDDMLLALRPSFMLHCYAISRAPRALNRLPWRCPPQNFLRNGYVAETIRVPGVDDGEYFTFLRRADHSF